MKKPNNNFNSCYVFLYAILLISADGFSAPMKTDPLVHVWPLSTARTGLLRQIPRLEPGLRLKEGVHEIVHNAISVCNALDWLVDSCRTPLMKEPVTESTDLLHRHGMFLQRTIEHIKQKVSNYLRNVLTTTMVIASGVLAPIGPSAKRMAIASATVATAIVAPPQRANAGVYKSYNNLNSFERLGTTPLFFVCNSGGNAYLQEDIQVQYMRNIVNIATAKRWINAR